jgi:thiamine-monophosphate kinase
MEESALIEALLQRLPCRSLREGGPGDDAALLARGDGRLCTVDQLVEGVHWDRRWSSPRDAGWKLLARNLSDVLAMGGRATSFVWTLAVAQVEDALGFAEGVSTAVAALCPGVVCVGGDVTRLPSGSVLTMTMLGAPVVASRVLWRSGAEVGDGLWVDGPLGWASAGLALLEAGELDAGDTEAERLRAAHRRPTPRAWQPAEVVGIHAAVDVSDGLVADAGHMARASGCRLVLQPPLPGWVQLAAAARRLGVDPLDWQLAGGDDYVRLVASKGSPGPAWQQVGRVEPGPPGVWVEGLGAVAGGWRPRWRAPGADTR